MPLSTIGMYIGSKIDEFGNGKTLHILDMGCGEGNIIEGLLPRGHVMYGYDFEYRREAAASRLQKHYPDNLDDHIKFTETGQKIPFDNQQFDLIYAIQVFEHVQFLESIFAECARVLKPEGRLIATFPLATTPIEPHLLIPFAHWLPPGAFRKQYLQLWYILHLRPHLEGKSAAETATIKNEYLQNNTYYRFLNEFMSVGEHYFQDFEIDTYNTLKTKLDLLSQSGSAPRRWLAQTINTIPASFLNGVISHLVNITLIFSNPRHSD